MVQTFTMGENVFPQIIHESSSKPSLARVVNTRNNVGGVFHHTTTALICARWPVYVTLWLSVRQLGGEESPIGPLLGPIRRRLQLGANFGDRISLHGHGAGACKSIRAYCCCSTSARRRPPRQRATGVAGQSSFVVTCGDSAKPPPPQKKLLCTFSSMQL